MGIKELLKVMKPYIERVHVKKYAGKRVGIDAYSWLHKGAYSCSMEICQRDPNKRNDRLPYLQYCMNRVNMLRYYNVIPVVVFDGGRLPSKSATEEERQRKRDANLDQARTKLSEGDVNGAIEFFQRAIDITPFIAYELIQILKMEGVEYVVAPYEADAQLAYLSILDPEKGGLAAIISEDSDLMAYGCNVVIYKMDQYGDGEEVVMDNVFNCTNVPAGQLSFRCFTQELFTGMCILAGCDFLSSIYGIGIKRAHSLVSKYKNLDRVLSVLQLDKKHQIPEGYVNSFKEANALFRYARVYDANMRCLSFLTPLPEGFLEAFKGNLDFLGPELPPSMVIAIAEGRMDPISMEAFEEFPQVPSQRHQVLPLNDRVASHKQPRGFQTENDPSPFVLFSQKAKDDFYIRAEEKSSQNLNHAIQKKQVSKKQESELLLEEVAETDCVLLSQEDCSLDKAITTHFRAMAEHSSLKRSSLSIDYPNANEMDNNGGVLDVRGQKRVFPPTPNNNPFKRSKPDDSVSVGQSLSKSLPEKSSQTESAVTHLCKTDKNSKIQGEETTGTDFTPESILAQTSKSKNKDPSNPRLVIDNREFSSPGNLGGPEVVSHSISATPISPSDASSIIQVMEQTVITLTSQPNHGTKSPQNVEARLVSSSPSAASCQRSARLKSKSSTRGNKSGSKNLPQMNSSIKKFFTKI